MPAGPGPRDCGTKAPAAYVAPPRLWECNSLSLTPLAKICRRSAATNIEPDGKPYNKSPNGFWRPKYTELHWSFPGVQTNRLILETAMFRGIRAFLLN
jgi:hypothetical protein